MTSNITIRNFIFMLVLDKKHFELKLSVQGKRQRRRFINLNFGSINRWHALTRMPNDQSLELE